MLLCDEEEGFDKMLSLKQNCTKLSVRKVCLKSCVDEEGEPRRVDPDFWAKVARALQLADLGVDSVRARRHDLQGGSWENLRAIWDALGASAGGLSSVHVTGVLFDDSYARMLLSWDSKESKERRWIDFQLILDTPPKQWPEYLKEELIFEEEEEED